MRKDLKRILAAAEQQARWRVELQRSGHYKLYPPKGGRMVATGSTPSSASPLRNLIAEMRRCGLGGPCERTVLGVHVEAVLGDDGIAARAAAALQPA